ncbi:20189_t:CDS:2, partial [Gigaspora rosea]
ETENKLPNTIEELKQLIEQRNLQTTLNFPISNQEEILSAIEFLKQDLALELFPDFAFKLISLLSTGWELFEEAEIDDDTPMQKNEPTQPTINTQGRYSDFRDNTSRMDSILKRNNDRISFEKIVLPDNVITNQKEIKEAIRDHYSKWSKENPPNRDYQEE